MQTHAFTLIGLILISFALSSVVTCEPDQQNLNSNLNLAVSLPQSSSIEPLELSINSYQAMVRHESVASIQHLTSNLIHCMQLQALSQNTS